ncbi:MAG: hypothetical protein OYH76_09330 [Defluviicoccus sp.]|nr:hypothetical protein [Defluviicoccus sp.]MDE0276085.1 hypothetical protein [Defluviicoccus sp.]
MGDAWDVARSAFFLASDDACVTGECLVVDGRPTATSPRREGFDLLLLRSNANVSAESA